MNVVVTGGTKGIGRAIAERFAAEGNRIIVCARTQHELDSMQQHFKDNLPTATLAAFKVDMSSKEETIAFGQAIINAGYTPDVLINNAGYFLPGSVYNEDEGSLEKMIAANLYSAYHFTRVLLPKMIEAKKGHIFNICSIASLQAYANGGAYSISKFALLGFSKNLREEMKPLGIKVTAVLPGATMTASWEGADIDPTRIMEVNDIAQMVFAASKLSAQAVVEDIVLRPQLGDL